jgi:hypothetical protein
MGDHSITGKTGTWLMLALALLCVTGCTGEEIPRRPPTPPSSIVFGDAVVTRGTLIEDKNLPEGARMGVFAHHISQGSVVNQHFINNLMVTRINGVYTYAPAHFWPDSGYLKFYAYYPYNDKAHLTSGDSLRITIRPASTEVVCLVDSSVSKQVDLMFASTQAIANENVVFSFSHVLTALEFEVKKDSLYAQTDVKLHAITLKNVKRSGTLTLATDTVWAVQGAAGNISIPLNASPATIGIDYRKVTGSDCPILIPQDTNGMTVSLDVEIGNNTRKRYDIDLKGTGHWKTNERITYKLIISDQLSLVTTN